MDDSKNMTYFTPQRNLQVYLLALCLSRQGERARPVNHCEVPTGFTCHFQNSFDYHKPRWKQCCVQYFSLRKNLRNCIVISKYNIYLLITKIIFCSNFVQRQVQQQVSKLFTTRFRALPISHLTLTYCPRFSRLSYII